MFGIPLLYLKLAGWAVLVLAIYGGYKYVDNLRDNNKELTEEKIQLEDMNDTLTTTLAESERMAKVRDEVSTISSEIRQNNVIVRENRETVINDSVTNGNDREVGPLLKEFFNAK
jgi:predicted Holliday junction resolvase-like endonuclease